jgi:hypothetical protein
MHHPPAMRLITLLQYNGGALVVHHSVFIRSLAMASHSVVSLHCLAIGTDGGVVAQLQASSAMRLILCVIVLLVLGHVIVRADEPIPVALGAVGFAYMNTFLPALLI